MTLHNAYLFDKYAVCKDVKLLERSIRKGLQLSTNDQMRMTFENIQKSADEVLDYAYIWSQLLNEFYSTYAPTSEKELEQIETVLENAPIPKGVRTEALQSLETVRQNELAQAKRAMQNHEVDQIISSVVRLVNAIEDFQAGKIDQKKLFGVAEQEHETSVAFGKDRQLEAKRKVITRSDEGR